MPKSSRQRPQQYNSHRKKERLDGAICKVEGLQPFDTVAMACTNYAATDVSDFYRFAIRISLSVFRFLAALLHRNLIVVNHPTYREAV
jgi:hypothetical protein